MAECAKIAVSTTCYWPPGGVIAPCGHFRDRSISIGGGGGPEHRGGWVTSFSAFPMGWVRLF